MMKFTRYMLLILPFSIVVDGTWKVGTIYNYSNLDFVAALYPHRNPAKKPIEIPQLTNLLLASNKQVKPIVTELNYTVASSAHGFAIIQASNGYELMFEDNPVHHVKTGRKHVKHKNVAQDSKIKKNYGNLAQVYLKLMQQNDQKDNGVKYAVLSYEQNSKQPFVIDVYVFGNSPRNYSIQLCPGGVNCAKKTKSTIAS